MTRPVALYCVPGASVCSSGGLAVGLSGEIPDRGSEKYHQQQIFMREVGQTGHADVG